MSLSGNRFLTRRRALIAGAAAVGASAVGLRACGRSEVPVDEQGRVRLRFALDWRAQADHGGFYQALASGAYEKRGLNVQIVQGGPAVNVPQLLASGAVELGMASNSFTPMNLVASGAPVRAVAAFFQKDPQILMAHPDDALRTIADLAERPFLIAQAGIETFWVWLKATYGFTDAQLRPYAYDPAAFIANARAVQQGFLTSDPYTIEQAADFEPKVFLLADEGYPSYGAIVLAPNAFARDNAAALRSFIAGSAEGWRDYIRGDASAGDALIRRDNPDMSQDQLDQARERLRDRAVVDGGDAALYGLGALTAERWQAFFEVTSKAGVYEPGLNWRDAFTDNYLPGRG